MKTAHKIYFENSKSMGVVPSSSVHLVVTSPPYPMIEMWDEMFSNQNSDIAMVLNKGDGWKAFELMHRELDPVWKEIYRILVNGGIACVNVGDATRTVADEFKLYPNHSRILAAMIAAGFVDEVRDLLARGYTGDLKSMQSIGYRHMLDYIDSRLSWEECTRTLKRDHRRYAKRQLTWFNADPEIIWKEPGQVSQMKDLIHNFLDPT